MKPNNQSFSRALLNLITPDRIWYLIILKNDYLFLLKKDQSITIYLYDVILNISSPVNLILSYNPLHPIPVDVEYNSFYWNAVLKEFVLENSFKATKIKYPFLLNFSKKNNCFIILGIYLMIYANFLFNQINILDEICKSNLFIL